MPRIAEFYGIAIYMFFMDHEPPHLHATYGEHRATVGIEPTVVLRGSLPLRAQRMVIEWATAHREELWDNWNRARQHEALRRVAPLD